MGTIARVTYPGSRQTDPVTRHRDGEKEKRMKAAANRGVDIDTLSVNTIRTLCMDAVQRANSGHPGTAMAMAPVAYTLWQRFLRFDPDHPIWPNRDRFVLSFGHV